MTEFKRCLLVMAREPVPGSVKTRLIPALGEQGACDIYRQLLYRMLDFCLESGIPVRCALSGNPEALRSLSGFEHIQWTAQCSGTLARRMTLAMQQTLELADQVIMVGTDCPMLDKDYLTDACAALSESDFVLGPAEDGGYVLLGSRLHSFWQESQALDAVEMGSEHAFAQTRQLLSEKGSVVVLDERWDVDRPEDVLRAKQAGLLW